MHLIVLLRFILYAVSITLHSILAIVLVALTNKKLLESSDRAYIPIIIGAIWAVVLSLLIGCDLTRGRKPGSENRDRRWIVRTWSELGVFFHLMFWEMLFCALNTHAQLKSDKCGGSASDVANPCRYRALIFGIWWSATATVTIYFWGLLFFGCLVLADLDSETNVRDYYDAPELKPHPRAKPKRKTKRQAYLTYEKQAGFGALEEVPQRFSVFTEEWDWTHAASSALAVPQAAAAR